MHDNEFYAVSSGIARGRAGDHGPKPQQVNFYVSPKFQKYQICCHYMDIAADSIQTSMLGLNVLIARRMCALGCEVVTLDNN